MEINLIHIGAFVTLLVVLTIVYKINKKIENKHAFSGNIKREYK
jgi:hypothetical protein